MTDRPKKPEPVRYGVRPPNGGVCAHTYPSESSAHTYASYVNGDIVPLYEHPPGPVDAKPAPACLSLAHQHGALRAILEVVTMDAALLANNMDLDATDLRAELQAVARRCAHVLELLDTCPANPLAQTTCDDYPRETP